MPRTTAAARPSTQSATRLIEARCGQRAEGASIERDLARCLSKGAAAAVVRGISWLLERSMRVAACRAATAETSSSAWSRPLLVRPYWGGVSRASCSPSWSAHGVDRPARCCSSRQHSAGRRCPTRLAHLLIASILSAPAALVVRS